jgi:hypothetical protein
MVWYSPPHPATGQTGQVAQTCGTEEAMKSAAVLLLSLSSGLAAVGCRDLSQADGRLGDTASSSVNSQFRYPEPPPLLDTEELDRRLRRELAVGLRLSSNSDDGIGLTYKDGSTCTIKLLDDGNDTATLTFNDGTQPVTETIRVNPETLNQWLARGLTQVRLPEGAHMTLGIGGQTIELGSAHP